MVLGVQVHPVEVIQTWDLLVGVHSCQNAANICLQGGEATLGSLTISETAQFCVHQDRRVGMWFCNYIYKAEENDVENSEHFILKW